MWATGSRRQDWRWGTGSVGLTGVTGVECAVLGWDDTIAQPCFELRIGIVEIRSHKSFDFPGKLFAVVRYGESVEVQEDGQAPLRRTLVPIDERMGLGKAHSESGSLGNDVGLLVVRRPSRSIEGGQALRVVDERLRDVPQPSHGFFVDGSYVLESEVLHLGLAVSQVPHGCLFAFAPRGIEGSSDLGAHLGANLDLDLDRIEPEALPLFPAAALDHVLRDGQ